MKQPLDLLARQEITFNEFARRTSKDWYRLADNLLKQFPVWYIEVRDLTQVMLFEAWTRVGTYDATRGKTLLEYVLFNSCDKAKKVLESAMVPARGVKMTMQGDAPTHPSSGTNRLYDSVASQSNPFDEFHDYEEAKVRFQAVQKRVPYRSAAALAALYLADGEINEAGSQLYNDAWARKQFGIRSPRSGVRLVRLAIGQARARAV